MGGMSKPNEPALERPPEKSPAPAPGSSDEASKRRCPAKGPREIGGPAGPEPTRYGDWERSGRVSDF